MGELVRLAPRLPGRDERLREAHAALVGAKLRWKGYRACNAAWLPGRCELCHTPFSEDRGHGTLQAGYSVVGGGPAGQDDYLWLCAACFADRCRWFGWQVVEAGRRQ